MSGFCGRVTNVKYYDVPLTVDDGGDEDDMMAGTSDREYWWNLFTTQGKMAFRVPNKPGSTEGFYTLHMEADLSIILKYQVGDPTDAQLWTVLDE